MSTPIGLEHQRKRWLRPDWQRWVRHDAHRFAPPNPDEHKSFAARRIEQRRADEDTALAAAQCDALVRDLAHLRWMLADLKFDLVWRRLCRKYGYNPNQPRVPAGNPNGDSGRATAETKRAQPLHQNRGQRPQISQQHLEIKF